MTAETPPKRPLFRPEAVAYHAQARTGGRTIDLRENLVAWLFRALLVAVGLAVLLAFTIRTETSARGPVVVDGDGNTASLFVADSRRLPDGAPVEVTVGGERRAGRVTGREPGLVTVDLDGSLPARARGEGRVPLGERSFAALLLGWDE